MGRLSFLGDVVTEDDATSCPDVFPSADLSSLESRVTPHSVKNLKTEHSYSIAQHRYDDSDGFWSLEKLQQLSEAQDTLASTRKNPLSQVSNSGKDSSSDKTYFSDNLIGATQTAAGISFCPWPPKHLRGENKKSTVRYNGSRFASLTEAALAGVLEHFVPSFKIIEGETYEVPLLGKSRVDFCINNVLVEFHAPRLGNDENNIGDFLTKDEYRKFKSHMSRVGRNKHQRKKLLRETRAKVFDTYVERRQTLLHLSPKKDMELIVVRSREEFYEKVLCRFARPETPLFPEFLAMFWWLVDVVLRESDMPRLRAFNADLDAATA